MKEIIEIDLRMFNIPEGDPLPAVGTRITVSHPPFSKLREFVVVSIDADILTAERDIVAVTATPPTF